LPVFLASICAPVSRSQESAASPGSGAVRADPVFSGSASLRPVESAPLSSSSNPSSGFGSADFGSPPSLFAAPPSPHTSALPGLTTPAFVEDLLYNPLQWGPFRVIPAANYRISYSTGLPNRGIASRDQETVQHAISPSLTLASPHLTLNYSPTLNYYSKGSYEDSLDHSASLRSSFGYGDWRFGISHAYSASSQVIVETARQTDTERHSTALTASHRFSDKTSFDLSLSQSFNDSSGLNSSGLNSSKTWSSMNYVNYHVTEITALGFGVGGGFTTTERGSDMTFEQIQGRVQWAPRPKIGASINGGVEIRQFLGREGASDQVNPIMGASATYRPFDQTGLTLSANRSVGSSIFTDRITETTSINLGLSQRLIQHLQANLSGGIRYADYQSSLRGLQVDRSDEILSMAASLSTRFLKRASASIGYSYSRNDSNESRFTYSSHTYFAQIGYSF
jgi:hypothetical protein